MGAGGGRRGSRPSALVPQRDGRRRARSCDRDVEWGVFRSTGDCRGAGRTRHHPDGRLEPRHVDGQDVDTQGEPLPRPAGVRLPVPPLPSSPYAVVKGAVVTSLQRCTPHHTHYSEPEATGCPAPSADEPERFSRTTERPRAAVPRGDILLARPLRTSRRRCVRPRPRLCRRPPRTQARRRQPSRARCRRSTRCSTRGRSSRSTCRPARTRPFPAPSVCASSRRGCRCCSAGRPRCSGARRGCGGRRCSSGTSTRRSRRSARTTRPATRRGSR